MADKKPNVTVPSGIVNTDLPSKILGGYPPEKGVEAIAKVNKPKKAPGSVRA